MAKATDRLVLENVGPISTATVYFKDLTVLVGPQATGKSLFLQFLKLVLDHRSIISTLLDHGLDWNSDTFGFLDLYLGRGMSGVWSAKGASKSWVRWQDQEQHIDAMAAARQSGRDREHCFFVPAQRVLAFSSQGWLRPFSDFRAGDPYVVRAFSDHLRVQSEKIFDTRKRIWHLDRDASALLQDSVFGRFEIGVQTSSGQKELVLRSPRSRRPLPFMVWSAGQREFIPLWLALIWLLPASNPLQKQRQNWIIIEEPEMGLHPKAITAVLFALLELLDRGYRVCLSTHSTHVLDLVWALQVFRKTQAPAEALLDLFGVQHRPDTRRLACNVMDKESSVYYFDATSRETRDISSLDPNDTNDEVNSWGGMTQFTTQIGEIIARQVADDRPK